MNCPRCQKELPSDASFCHSCGASLNEDATQRMEYPKSTFSRSRSFDSIDDARFVPGTILAGRDWLGIATGTIILASVFVTPVIGSEPLASLILMISVVLILIFCAVRFGPIALFACLTVFHLWIFFPITTDFSTWYTTAFAADLVFLVLLAVYGYYISLGGQPMFSGKLLRED
jgi:Double zinc ribbon